MSSSRTPSHLLSNFSETAEVRVLSSRGLPRSNYKLAHVVVSSRVYWKTANEDATSEPLSLIDLRNANSLELLRQKEGAWDEVEEIVKIHDNEGRRCITVRGRLRWREQRNRCFFGRDVQVEIIPQTPTKHEAWVNKIRARIVPWSMLQREIRNAPGVEEVENALAGLTTRMMGTKLSSISTDEVEEKRMDRLVNLPEKIQKLSFVDKLTTHGAGAVASGGTLEKLVKSAGHVNETAELLADLSKCFTGLSAIFQLISLSAQAVSMWAEASRGQRILVAALGQTTILLRYVLESLVKIMKPSLNVNETAIDFVFDALKEAVSIMDIAEAQILRGMGSQIVNAEDVKKVETKIEQLKQMAVIADNASGLAGNTLRISLLDEKVSQLEGERHIRGDVPHHVRPSVSAFFSGRKKELRILNDILRDRGSAVITQYGGVGKTELMIAFANRAEQDGQVPGGVFWVTVDGNEKDVIVSLAGLAEKLLLKKMSEQDRRNANLVIAWLKQGLGEREGRWLLCLDNADDREVGAILNEICGIAGPSRMNGWIMVTSRQGRPQIWARMKSEQKLVLKPLCPEDATLVLWRQVHKIEMTDADDDKVMTEIMEMKDFDESEYCALKKLCGDSNGQGLGGLPLALVQAGSFIAEFEYSFTEYLNLFEELEDVMKETEELTSIRKSQRSIWTTWKINVGKLSLKALMVLRALSMLGHEGIEERIVNGILTTVAADGGGNVRRMFREIFVEELIHGASLVCRDKGGEERCKYKMHRLVQLFIHKEMGHGSAIWNDVFSLALPTIHECVKTELEKEGNTFYDLPDVFEIKHRELVVHSLSLVHHHRLPARGVEICNVSELMNVHRYSGKMMEFMGKSEEEVQVWEHLLAILDHQQSEDLRRKNIDHGRNHEEWKSNIASVYNLLGCALMRAGKLDRAALKLEESLKMKREIHALEQPHPEVALSLSNLGKVYRKMGNLEKALEKHEESMEMERAIHRHGKPHRNIAKSLHNIGIVYRQMGRLDKALEKHEQSLYIEREIHGQDKLHPNIAKSLDNLGLVYRQMGKLEEALEKHNQSLNMKQAIHDNAEPHPDIAKSFDNLGNVYRQMGRLEEAWEKHDQSLKMKRTIHANIELHPDIAMSFDNLGLVYEAMGELEKALKKHEQSLAMKRAIYGHEKLHPGIARSLDNLGNVYRRMGKLDKALEKYTESSKMKRAIYGQGKPHPDVAKTFDNLGLVYESMGELDKAQEKHEQSLKMKRAIYDRIEPHPDIANSLDNLGLVFRQRGKLRKALKKHEESLEMKRAIYGDSEVHSDITKSFDNLGVVYRKLGNLDEALKKHEQSMRMKREIYGQGKPHPNIAKSLDNLGLVYRLKEKLDDAMEKHEQSLKMKREIHGPGKPHSDIAKSFDNIGLVYRQKGDLDAAQKMHEQSLAIKREIHGQDKPHRDIISSLTNLSFVHRKKREQSKVLHMYEEIVDMIQAIHGEDKVHPEIARSLDNLGNMYRQVRKLDKALETHEKSLEMKQAIHGDGNANHEIAKSFKNLGLVYRDMKDMERSMEKAIEMYEQSLEMKREIHGHGTSHSDITKCLDNLGSMYLQVNSLEKALERNEQSLAMKQNIHGYSEPHPSIAKSLDNLGSVYRQMGDLYKALEKHKQSLEMKKAIHGHDSSHPDIRRSRNNLENLENQKNKELEKAQRRHEQSLEIV